MTAVFLGSFVASHKLPEGGEPRIAFLGRSNVGKSSIINLLSGTKIAKVSKKPGKTLTLNLYKVNEEWILGDFPGYGYAKVPAAIQKQFEALVKKFLTPEYFSLAVQIVDARHPAMDSDMQLHQWLNSTGLTHFIVLNKADKLNRKERAETEIRAKRQFPKQSLLFASALTGEGKRELEKGLHNMMFT